MARPSAVALGVFDGVHIGHQRILQRLVANARAAGASATVVTFDPHPAAVVSADGGPLLIATLAQRLEWMEILGVEQVRVMDFTSQVAQISADDFVSRVLVAQLGAVSIAVGDDVHFGRDRAGDADFLRQRGIDAGFAVDTIATVGDGARYSSTLVRSAVASGQVDVAHEILGRPFVLRGRVVHGDARGRQIGYPTANLEVADRQLLPALGIYAGAIRIEGRWWGAAISVGTRPQFYDGATALVEVFVLDYRGDLYDTEVDVAFVSFLRGEARFASLEALVEQMGRDVSTAQEKFREFSPQSSLLLG